MFGIDDALLFPLIGGAMGALTNRKDPLMGAVIGGGLGLAGNAIPGMIPTQPAAPIVEAGMPQAWATAADGLKAQELGLGMTDKMGWQGATSGMPGLLNSATEKPGLLNTATNAAQTASAVKSLMPPQQPIPQAPGFTTGGGTQMGGVYKNIQDARMANAQAEMQRRMGRMKQLNRFG